MKREENHREDLAQGKQSLARSTQGNGGHGEEEDQEFYHEQHKPTQTEEFYTED